MSASRNDAAPAGVNRYAWVLIASMQLREAQAERQAVELARVRAKRALWIRDVQVQDARQGRGHRQADQ